MVINDDNLREAMIKSIDEAEHLLELVLRSLGRALTAAQHADILERLSWSCDDPDGFLLAVRDKWLRGSDRHRVDVALSFQETFPFRDRSEMEVVLRAVCAQWPEFAPRCEEMLASRAEHVRRE